MIGLSQTKHGRSIVASPAVAAYRFGSAITAQGILMKTVLITGCSSGFGLEAARYFLDRDWQVVATMRTPRDDVMRRSERLRVLALDVTNPDSIRQAVQAAG